jgi:hypothetical protein
VIVVEESVIMVLAIVGIALASAYVPLLGLVAIAWASFRWVGLFGAIVVTLFWCRWGPSVTLPWWPPRTP